MTALAQWDGKVRYADADGRPGHYYVSVRSRGRYVLALGPFTQRAPGGQYAHAKALGLVRAVRRYVSEHDRSRYEPWYEYGTCRLPLEPNPPAGRLNAEILP